MSDPRLGRIFVPDGRDFHVDEIHVGVHEGAIPPSQTWADATVLDQGDFGTCVGNGWAGWGDSEPIVDDFNETDARAIYYEATVIDGQPDDPDKPGGGQQGSTVRSGAKAMQNRGNLAAYAFTTSLSTIREWLANHGPVVFGTDWTEDMFNPDGTGLIHATGAVAGGHCYLCTGYDTLSGTFRFRNSWGPSFGAGGDFWLSATDVQKLLTGIDSPGEACMALEVGTVPVPPSPAPPPAPSDANAAFAAVLKPWVAERHYGDNKKVQIAARVWLATQPEGENS
jgi:hypothetical protein